MKYIVYANKFHGGRVLYEGHSEKQAIKSARKHDCIDVQIVAFRLRVPLLKRCAGAVLRADLRS